MSQLVDMVLTGMLTLFFAFIGSFIMWKLIGPRVVVAAIQARMGPILMHWLVTPSMETGKMKTAVSDDGEESQIPEILSPLDMMMSSAGEVLYRKMLGKIGGDRRKVGAVQKDIVEGLSDPSSPFAGFLGAVNPRLIERAIRDGDYVPIILDQLGPLAAEFLKKKLEGQASNAF